MSQRQIEEFVQRHKGVTQRGAEWYTAMGTTIGGSEIAALLGCNPYKRFFDVVEEKVAILTGIHTFNGGEACWWGSLFEDIGCEYVSIDVGAPVIGDDICVQLFNGHRNSPDGYVVAKFYMRDGQLHLWTTDMDESIECTEKVLLLEFKCPMSRKPTGEIPKQYVPQLHSGLSVTACADFGMFVDFVFRKCNINDLGPSGVYDTEYHKSDKDLYSGKYPIAWGMIGVYAPRLDAPRHIRLGWKNETWAEGDPDPTASTSIDAADAAWNAYLSHFKFKPNMAKCDTSKLVDMGGADTKIFSSMLKLIDAKRFRINRTSPWFEDGRGNDETIDEALFRFDAETPEHYWLVGVLPWKLFEVNYAFINRRAGFLEEVMPLISKVHALVADAIKQPDPINYVKAEKRKQMKPSKKFIATEDDINAVMGW